MNTHHKTNISEKELVRLTDAKLSFKDGVWYRSEFKEGKWT